MKKGELSQIRRKRLRRDERQRKYWKGAAVEGEKGGEKLAKR